MQEPDAMSRMNAGRISRIAMIAAIYAASTLVCMLFTGTLSWGPVQLRVSEALCILALFTPDAVWGLSLGCALANLANIALSGYGVVGLFDVVFGSLATGLGAAFMWRLRARPAVALLGPVAANALIVPAYLPLMVMGLGFYTIPFTSVTVESSWLFMYLFGVVSCGVGEALVLYIIGLPLYEALAKTPLAQMLRPDGKDGTA